MTRYIIYSFIFIFLVLMGKNYETHLDHARRYSELAQREYYKAINEYSQAVECIKQDRNIFYYPIALFKDSAKISSEKADMYRMWGKKWKVF